MPKKYKQKSLLTKPTSSAPSYLSLSKASASENGTATKSVNDLIRESRRGTGNERPQSSQTASSVPPSLRVILDMPAPPQPAPRLGIRGPTRLRRIPGPPPPRSWLKDSAHAPNEVRGIPWSKAHERIRIQKQSSNLPAGFFPSSTSLQHKVMKSMASNWSWHAGYDHEYLAELPVKIKETLLSYIAIYSEGQGPNPLRLFFPSDLVLDEQDEVRRLDLGNAIGGWSTIKKIDRELERDKARLEQPVLPVDKIPDTWDEVGAEEQLFIPAPLYAGGMRFRNLKHLSLAVAPGTTASVTSWTGLLTLAGKLSTITSLSLAHWPQPTYTPNASTSMVRVSQSNSGWVPPVTYGGTNFYTAFDNDWREASGILRSLSRLLYCLKWLDLTGCGLWFPALSWVQPYDEDEITSTTTGPDWNGSWRGLEHLILAVGWSPGPSPLDQLPLSHAPEQINYAEMNTVHVDDDRISDLLSQLSSVRLGSHRMPEYTHPESWNVEYEREKYYHRLEVERCAEIEIRARQVASELRAIRKKHGGKWIDVDFGSKD